MSGIEGIQIVGDSVIDVPATTTKTVLLSAGVDEGKGKKGSNPIFFEIRAQNSDKIAVREKASFFLP